MANEENTNKQQEYYDEYEIDLREYIILLWDNKVFIGVLVLIAILAAFLISSFLIEPTYETKAKIQLSNYDGLYSNPDTVVQILSSTGLMKEVMQEFDEKISVAKLSSYINNNLDVNQINNTKIISLTIKNNEPQLALNIAEGLIDKFRSISDEYFQDVVEREREYISDLKTDLKRINSDLESNQEIIRENRNTNELETVSLIIQENSSLRDSRRDLRKEIETRESKLLNFYSLEVLDEPYLPENPTSPNIRLNVAIAAVLALMLAVFIIFFREFMKED